MVDIERFSLMCMSRVKSECGVPLVISLAAALYHELNYISINEASQLRYYDTQCIHYPGDFLV